MTYNELAQVLETKNPDTGKLYPLEDLNVITMEDAGTAMLEDGVFVAGDWIAEEANQDIARRFLKASFQGWIFCRDNQDECVQHVLNNGPTLGEGHQSWQMNEINALIWPNAAGIGVMDEAAFPRTADIAKQFGVIKPRRRPRPIAPTSPRRPWPSSGGGRRRERRRLEEGDRRGDAGRRVAESASRATTEKGDPMSVLIKGGRVVTAADDTWPTSSWTASGSP